MPYALWLRVSSRRKKAIMHEIAAVKLWFVDTLAEMREEMDSSNIIYQVYVAVISILKYSNANAKEVCCLFGRK